MYSVCHNYLLLYCLKFWKLVSALLGLHQVNIYKNLKLLMHIHVKKKKKM
jgi:hypothetical protein